MKLRKKLKKFFTLSRRPNAGFTLIEMLVVIAVMSILGGAGAVGYNAYAKNAAEKADWQIISAVWTPTVWSITRVFTGPVVL